MTGYSSKKSTGYIHHDMSGNVTGASTEKAYGYVHSDRSGRIVGQSTRNIWGGYDNYDENGNYVDHTNIID